jgi:hypothetical protein
MHACSHPAYNLIAVQQDPGRAGAEKYWTTKPKTYLWRKDSAGKGALQLHVRLPPTTESALMSVRTDMQQPAAFCNCYMEPFELLV